MFICNSERKSKYSLIAHETKCTSNPNRKGVKQTVLCGSDAAKQITKIQNYVVVAMLPYATNIENGNIVHQSVKSFLLTAIQKHILVAQRIKLEKRLKVNLKCHRNGKCQWLFEQLLSIQKYSHALAINARNHLWAGNKLVIVQNINTYTPPIIEIDLFLPLMFTIIPSYLICNHWQKLDEEIINLIQMGIQETIKSPYMRRFIIIMIHII